MNFSDPENNIRYLSLEPGMQVADLGVGSGYYTLAAARLVGEDGRIYAIDIQKDLLSKVKNSAAQNRLGNVEVIWADLEREGGSNLRESSIDAAIISNVLFQVENKPAFLKEAWRILKSRGKILFIDWADSFSGLGPSPAYLLSKESAQALFLENGFSVVRELPVGEYHYGFLVQKV